MEPALHTKIPVVDGEFFILYADDAAALPSQNVTRELAHAAIRYRDETRRDWKSFTDAAAMSGMIGSAAWASTVAGYRALRTYWHDHGASRQRVTAATALAKAKEICADLGKAPDRLDVTEVKQAADGNWRIDLTVDAAHITVWIDEHGRLVHWIRHPDS